MLIHAGRGLGGRIGHKGALAAQHEHVALVAQRGIGLVDRVQVDTEVLCERAHAGQRVARPQVPHGDTLHDLVTDLLVDGRL